MRHAVLAGLGLAVLLGAATTGCAAMAPGKGGGEAPWKTSEGEIITAAPDAGGVLSFRNCPTLAEARAAMPAITGGPDANGVPFKTMVLQCSYGLPGRDVQGQPAGISILVFDAEAEGRAVWGWALGPEFGEPEPIANLGDSAFVTTGGRERDVWVNAGRFGLHLMGPGTLELGEVAALAQAAVTGLQRPPR